MPEIGRGLGKALKEFKDTQREVKDALDVDAEPKQVTAAKTPPPIQDAKSVKEGSAIDSSEDTAH